MAPKGRASKAELAERHKNYKQTQAGLSGRIDARQNVNWEVSEEERKEWESKRVAAHKQVKSALKSRGEDMVARHPIRTFGINLHVVLIHHTKNAVQRKMVIMPDNLRFKKDFLPWLNNALYGKSPPRDSLTLQFVDVFGAIRPMLSPQDYASWFDVMWYKHPPELHVYDMPALMKKAEARWNAAEELFHLYDIDGNGKIDMDEMLMAKQMTSILDLSRKDVKSFLTDFFAASDVDKDHTIDFKEFVDCFNNMTEQMQSGLVRESKAGYTQAQLKYQSLSSRSWMKTVEQIAEHRIITIDDTKSSLSFDDLRKQKGWLCCDANERRDYAVRLRITADAVTEENKSKWVQVQTWTKDMVDGFTDMTGKMGFQMSPLVHVEFEEGMFPPKTEGGAADKPAPFQLFMPHAFSERVLIPELTKEYRKLEKGDMLVVHSVLGSDVWTAVPTHLWDMVPGPESIGEIPSLRLLVDEPGTYAAYSLVNLPPTQRVQALAFVPSHVIPLDPLQVRVWLVPDTPDQIDAAIFNEVEEDGLVIMAGWCSEIFEATPLKTKISLTLTDADDPTDEPRVVHTLWGGEATHLEFVIFPEDWADEMHMEAGVMEEEYKLRVDTAMMGSSRSSIYAKAAKNPDSSSEFKVKITAHNFPPPSEPFGVEIVSRTAQNVKLRWDVPAYWGGCALSHYDVEYAEIPRDVYDSPEWREDSWQPPGGEWTAARGPFAAFSLRNPGGSYADGSIAAAIYAAKFRIRAYNCGSHNPGPWSAPIIVDKPQGGAAGSGAEKAPVPKGPKRASTTGGAAAVVETGIAVVEDDDDLQNKKMAERTYRPNKADMATWSPFARAIGTFFCEAGVHGGARGKLFGLNPLKVENLTLANLSTLTAIQIAEDGISDTEPLVALGCTAVWVMETLAHHVENPDAWIPLLQSVNGLLHLAAHECIGELREDGSVEDPELSTEKQMRSVLYSLIEIFETMRQTEPGGYITTQLRTNYSKTVKATLAAEWEERLAHLRHEIGSQVMSMAEVHALHAGRPSSSETVLLKHAATKEPYEKLASSMKFKVDNLNSRLNRVAAGGETTKEITFFKISAENLFCGGGKEVDRVAVFRGKLITGDAFSGKTLKGNHRINPRWADQCVSFRLEEEEKLAYPLDIEVEIVDGAGNSIGSAMAQLKDPFGRCCATLDVPGHIHSGKENAASTFEFYYRVGPWIGKKGVSNIHDGPGHIHEWMHKGIHDERAVDAHQVVSSPEEWKEDETLTISGIASFGPEVVSLRDSDNVLMRFKILDESRPGEGEEGGLGGEIIKTVAVKYAHELVWEDPIEIKVPAGFQGRAEFEVSLRISSEGDESVIGSAFVVVDVDSTGVSSAIDRHFLMTRNSDSAFDDQVDVEHGGTAHLIVSGFEASFRVTRKA